jgi:hypothetical protein
MTTEIKIIGFTDKVTDCDCCGKTGLKGTYCVSIDGNEFYYGSTCATKNTGITSETIKKEVVKINNISNVDLLMSEAKSEYAKVKIYTQAVKKGYSKDDFFKKYGKLDHSSNWEHFYEFAHLIHRISI